MQKIIIDGFGPIRDLELSISEFLVLIGEQATGKSTLAKLIYFFKSIRHDLTAYLYDETELDRSIEQHFFSRIRKKFTPDFFGTTKHMSPFRLRYNYGGDRWIAISLNKSNKVNITFSDSASHKGNGQITYKQLSDICLDIQNFRKEYFRKDLALLSTRLYREIEFKKRQKSQEIEKRINSFIDKI